MHFNVFECQRSKAETITVLYCHVSSRSHVFGLFFHLTKMRLQRILAILPQNMIIAAETVIVFYSRSHFLVCFFTLKNLLQRILVILPQNMIIAAETITVFHSYVSADLMFLVCFFTLTNFCCKEFWSSYPNMGIAAAQPMLPNPTLCTYCGVHY